MIFIYFYDSIAVQPFTPGGESELSTPWEQNKIFSSRIILKYITRERPIYFLFFPRSIQYSKIMHYCHTFAFICLDWQRICAYIDHCIDHLYTNDNKEQSWRLKKSKVRLRPKGSLLTATLRVRMNLSVWWGLSLYPEYHFLISISYSIPISYENITYLSMKYKSKKNSE